MRKRLEASLNVAQELGPSSLFCCKKLKCLSVCSRACLQFRQLHMLALSQGDCRRALYEMTESAGAFFSRIKK